MRFLWLPLLAVSVVMLNAGSRPVMANERGSESGDVSALIEALGADSYATRVMARERLQRMGLEAFDQLHRAQFHPDNEISMAARYLVSSLLVSWSKESDPPEVRDALQEYGGQSESDRANRIDMLAELPERKGLPALVRLARFETQLRLSRKAALALMQQPMQGDPAERRRNAEIVNEVLGSTDRQAADWLRVYARDLARGDYSADDWSDLIADQRKQIDSLSTDQSTRESVLELVRVCSKRAAASGMMAEALQLADDNSDLIPPTTRDLVEACRWATDHQLHPFVLALKSKHERIFGQTPILLYNSGLAMKSQGDQESANRLADEAAAINPLPATEEEREKLAPKDLEDKAQAHREIALKLWDRGLFEWAEREFRLIIDALTIDDRTSVAARDSLAEMFAELERHQDVVDILTPLTDRLKKDNQLQRQINMMIGSATSRRLSQLEYHSALALAEAGKLEEARKKMAEAFQAQPSNIDILIRMYRTDGDDEWKRSTLAKVNESQRLLYAVVQQSRVAVRAGVNGARDGLAESLNNYAWLVCNTEGDFEKALQSSLESLELGIDSARLDTCARCYFAMDDFDNAIRMQKRALKLSPYSAPLRRQLTEFEEAKQAADAEGDGGETSADA